MNGVIKRLVLLAVAVLAVTVVMAALPGVAQAQTASLSVRVVLASNDGGGADGSLSSIASPLRSRFGQYSSFRLLANHTVSINQGGSRSIGLPNGQTVTISFQGMSGSSYRIAVSLPGGGTTVTAPRGGIFFVAGPRYQGGLMIIAITP